MDAAPRPRLALVSLGCRVSRADGEALARRLAPGFERCAPGQGADVVVVHTCTITRDADATARQAIRRLAREHPSARIVAAGCYAEVDPAALAGLPGVAAVVGARDGAALAEVVAGLAPARARPAGAEAPPDPHAPARPLWKVQDGCDEACAYCAVPLARGPSRSLPFDEALAGLLALGTGRAEVVLTGVHLGHYGRDLTPPRSLADLVRAAVAGGLTARLRLSSVEPLEVPLDLWRDPATAGALCPHLHLPLQSGSARVLGSMGRPYDPGAVRRVVAEARALRPGLCLGADVLAGFPGETEADHAATLALCRDLGLDYLHVFAYSPRPGTAAATRTDQVAPAVARARAAHLRALSAERWAARLTGRVGQVLRAVVERVEGGEARGTAEDHTPLRWAAGPELRGAACRLRVEAVEGGACRAVRLP